MTVAEGYNSVVERICEAAYRASRSQNEVKLIAVTKTVDVPRIREAIAAGASRIGENRVQELFEKSPLLPTDTERHLIGRLQTNKVKRAVNTALCIHSVDRLPLALEIEREAAKAQKVQDVLIEVNIGEDTAKAGVAPDGLCELLDGVLILEHIRVVGLMTVPPICPSDEARKYFASLRELLRKVQGEYRQSAMTELSMGMSNDFEEAIEEGATYVRVGSAIFGSRS